MIKKYGVFSLNYKCTIIFLHRLFALFGVFIYTGLSSVPKTCMNFNFQVTPNASIAYIDVSEVISGWILV